MDLTPEDIKILYLAAEAFLDAGDPITIGGDTEANLPVVLGLIAADPRFRAGVLAAYRAGLDAAAEAVWTKAAELRGKPFRRGDVGIEYVNGMEDASEIARGQHPRTPGEDVTP